MFSKTYILYIIHKRKGFFLILIDLERTSKKEEIEKLENIN